MAASQTSNKIVFNDDELMTEFVNIALDGSTATVYTIINEVKHVRACGSSSSVVPRIRRSNHGVLLAAAAGSVGFNLEIQGT